MAAKKKSKKAPAKKSKKKVAKAARRAPAKKAAKRKAKSARKAPKKVSAKKTPAKKKAVKKAPSTKKEYGEGNYKATQRFDKAQEGFVQAHKSDIPAMGKAAEAALAGPEGKDLMAAEAEAKGHAAGEEP